MYEAEIKNLQNAISEETRKGNEVFDKLKIRDEELAKARAESTEAKDNLTIARTNIQSLNGTLVQRGTALEESEVERIVSLIKNINTETAYVLEGTL